MGIPLFRKALLKRLAHEAISSRIGNIGKVDILLFDANSILHQVTHYYCGEKAVTKDDYSEIAKLIVHVFKQIISKLTPEKLLVIAVDGPVPISKIRQQKQRRYKNAMELIPGNYDSNVLTPGTSLQFKIGDALQDALAEIKRDFGIPHVIYSSHLVPGEGEHKMMKHVREYIEKNGQPEYATVIYGNDSDLLLLGLTLDIKFVFVAKDPIIPTDFQKNDIIEMPGPVTNIDELRLALVDEFRDTVSGIQEFIFACTLLGNDFLPRSPLLCNIDRGLSIIIDTLKKISILEDTGKFIASLAYLEDFDPALGIAETEQEEGNPDISFNAVYNDYLAKDVFKSMDGSTFVSFQSRIFDAMVEAEIVDMKTFRSLWYQQEFSQATNRQLVDVLNMCASYIRGLNWVYNYYFLGQDSVTWLWYYPYNHAPLFTDLAASFRAVKEKTFAGYSRIMNVEHIKDEVRPSALQQLLFVMPQQSLPYVPEVLQVYYAPEGPLRHLMPIKAVLEDTDFCQSPFQGIVIVPDPVYHVIMNNLAAKYINKDKIEKYAIRKEISDDKPVKPRVIVKNFTRDTNTRGSLIRQTGIERKEFVPSAQPRGRGRGRGEARGRGRGTSTRGDSSAFAPSRRF